MLISILVIALGAGLSPSQAPAKLSIERAVELYLARNPGLRAAEDGVDSALGRRQQSETWPNPQLDFSQENLPVGADRVRFFQDQEFALGASQLLELGGKRQHRQAIAASGVEIARAELEDRRRLGVASVREAFLRAAFAQRRSEFASEQLESYHRIRRIQRERFEAGDVSGLSQLRLELEEVRFLAALNQARNDFNASWAELSAAIGWAEPQPAELDLRSAEPLVETSLEELRRMALESRPDLNALKLREEQSRQRIALERAQRTPDLTVGGGYKRNFGVNSFYASLSLPIPIFNRNSGSIAEAEAEHRRHSNRRLWAELMIRAEVERLHRSYDEQLETVRTLESGLLQKADRVFEATQVSFQEGEADLIDYLDALRIRLEASMSYNDLLLQLERSRVQLQRAVAADLP